MAENGTNLNGTNLEASSALDFQYSSRTGHIDPAAGTARVEDSEPSIAHQVDELHREIRRLNALVATACAGKRAAERRAARLDAENRHLRVRLIDATHTAYHDALTGLPNRRLFNDRLTQAMAQADRLGKPLAIMLLDLDGFKEANDRYGHQVGDSLLVQVSQRLDKCTREADTVCRYGGDEFVIMLPSVSGHSAVARLKDKIHTRLTAPYCMDNHQVALGVSIGVAVYPHDARDKRELIRRADLSMYMVKNRRRTIDRVGREEVTLTLLSDSHRTG